MTKKKEETKEKKNTLKEGEKKGKKTTSSKGKKESIVSKLVNFINGVKSEFKRVKWPTKKDMVKYSVVTIIFIICCSLFFYLIDIILAALHSLGK